MPPPLNKPAAIRAAIVLPILGAFEGAALVVTLGYTVYSIRGLPTVAALLGRVTPYKLLALVIAIPSSLEEVFFRSSLMNLLSASFTRVGEYAEAYRRCMVLFVRRRFSAPHSQSCS